MKMLALTMARNPGSVSHRLQDPLCDIVQRVSRSGGETVIVSRGSQLAYVTLHLLADEVRDLIADSVPDGSKHR